MKYSRILTYGVTYIVCLLGQTSFGDVVAVHQAITDHAVTSVLTLSSNYFMFLGANALDFSDEDARVYLIEGSAREDDPVTKFSKKDEGQFRSMNHFYDPLDTNFGKGLSDTPVLERDRLFGFGGVAGTNSFSWGSLSNSVGISTKFNNPQPTNIWSWQNARYYEWLGLTSTNRFDRHSAFMDMFRAVGQVMHLLQDTSQPQHARNEQHLDNLIGIDTPWRSPIEDYGDKHKDKLNYVNAMLDWRGAGFTKLEDFWDRHMYQGHASALNADTNGGTSTLGLAEWCNGNFLGARHLYGEYYPSNSIKHQCRYYERIQQTA